MALGTGMITAGVIAGAGREEEQGPGSYGGISLVAYDSCDNALTELKNRIIPHVGPYGLEFGGLYTADGGMPMAAEDSAGEARAGAPAPGEMAPQPDQSQPKDHQRDHSTTNVHEAGVDEPDLVKTDGKRVVSIVDGVLRVVDVASRAQTAAVRLDGENGAYPTQMLISGDRALVMTAAGMAYGMPDVAPGMPRSRPAPDDVYGSQLVLVDLTGAGKILGTLAVDGGYLDARQIGSVARVVVTSAPRFEFRYPQSDAEASSTRLENQEIVAGSTIDDWLPRYELTTDGMTTSGQLTECVNVSHPAEYTGSAMLTVLTVDLRRELGTGDPVTIVADGNTVYGTDKSLYVANNHATIRGDEGTSAGGRTELYQFDITGEGKPVHVATGAVDGSLLNQYSLSEFDGHLRVATTSFGGGGSQSGITVLARKGNQLTQVGQVTGLGVGERIYAVRYFGDTAYVVTFRETDPLYTVDLSDPAGPKVTGELKIPGYSAYLHPAGEGRLIGVGQEADEKGGVRGAQVSLFDTTNPAGATRIAQFHLPGAMSDAEFDPHAFLYWPDKGLVVLPISGNHAQNEAGALVLRLTEGSFERIGVLGHESAKYGDFPVVPRRSVVIGNELWTVSEAGMMVNDLDSLSQLAWLPFS